MTQEKSNFEPFPDNVNRNPDKASKKTAFGELLEKKMQEEESKKQQKEIDEKSIILAQEAEQAFNKNDFKTALEKLQQMEQLIGGFSEESTKTERLEKLEQEFDRQVATLLNKDYLKLAGMNKKQFLSHIDPLRERIKELATTEKEIKEGHIPFVIVVKNDVIGVEKAMPLIELEGKKGYTTRSADEIKGFKPIEGVKIPNGRAYLAIDIETGKTSLGITPDEAIKKIKKEDRSPLTIDEGVALITHHPEILKDHYVWAPGSRHGDDKVANLWLYEGEPRLNWGWANYSNAEWGSASCGKRVG